MAKQAQSAQPSPGQYFRVPKLGARPRFLREGGNGEIGFIRNQGASVQAKTQKFDQLDIIRGYMLMLKLDQTYNGHGDPLVDSPFFPFNMVDSLSVQFESSYKTFNLPGWLAAIMQQYRPSFSNRSGLGMLTFDYANTQQGNVLPNAGWSQPTLLTPAFMTHATEQITIPFEIPTSMEFDLYWELDLAGNPLGVMPRCVVSPQYMAATTRNVIPRLVLSQGLTVEDLLNGPVAISSGDAGTFVDNGSEADFYRDCWFPAPIYSTPPVHPWQYSRDFIEFPTSGQSSVPIPLDADTAGQGQILSIVCMTWDPDAAEGFGAPVPLANYDKMELVYSSKLTIFEDTPETNQARWVANHGTQLPPGCFGWDLALTEDGKLTNENALNTLVEAGCQVREVFSQGNAPSATSTTYVGMEILKAVNG